MEYALLVEKRIMDPIIIISVFGALLGCLYLGYRLGRRGGYAVGHAAGLLSGKDLVRRESTHNVRRTRPQPKKETEEPAWMD
jgi:membrane protein DedA with SNARE-associated domain